METCTFYVGSNNYIKLEAVKKALLLIGISGRPVIAINASSKVKEQPSSLDETINGATNRALAAYGEIWNQHKGDNATVCIGIENGLIMTSHATFDIAVVAADVKGYGFFYSTSSGIVLPNCYVSKASNLGFYNTTVGSIIAKELGGDPADPHATLSGNLITRMDILVEAIKIALLQARHAIKTQQKDTTCLQKAL